MGKKSNFGYPVNVKRLREDFRSFEIRCYGMDISITAHVLGQIRGYKVTVVDC